MVKMMILTVNSAVAALLLTFSSCALAAFNSASQNSIAVYWGQNSYGDATSQQRLSTYCANSKITIIPVAFLTGIKTPITNFANAGSYCTVIAGTQLLQCPQIEEDIKTCQSIYGKTILLSFGGATYKEGGFTSLTFAQAAAINIWNLFGPNTSYSIRPFGTAVVDGFDFDFESEASNLVPFAQQLRDLMDSDTSKKYYLSAAPQCPYPDAADNEMLNGAIYLDFIMVQFYNNVCGVNSFLPDTAFQSSFNFQTWDTWAKQTSKNKNVKVLLGVPGNIRGGSGYVPASTLAPVISYCKRFSSFGGVMVWDASQLWANPGFLDIVYSSLTSGGSVVTTTSSKTSTTSTGTTTASTSPTSTLVPYWGQCGGWGYTGFTQCAPPYTCVANSIWWSSCH